MADDLVSKTLARLSHAGQEAKLDQVGPIAAVKIVGSVIGDYWLVFSDTEPFESGDGLPIYRPSEIRT